MYIKRSYLIYCENRYQFGDMYCENSLSFSPRPFTSSSVSDLVKFARDNNWCIARGYHAYCPDCAAKLHLRGFNKSS